MELLNGTHLATLLTLPGVGEKRALLIAQHYQTWQNLLTASADDLGDVLGPKTGSTVAEQLRRELQPDPVLPPGICVTSRYDQDYPAVLREISDPPLLLWHYGTLPASHQRLLAIVGTRAPNQFGTRVAYLAAATAAQYNIATVSGLALGVDSIAHTATLDAGLPTWAILGQGVDTLPRHGDRATLARRILDNGGGLIAEVPPGTPVAAHLLTKRNRLQSGMASAVFIAQTGLATDAKPAGTLHTARFAIEQHRTLAVAVPPASVAHDPALAGNLALTAIDGIDPGLLHATAPATIAALQSRRPAADLSIASIGDLDALCQAVTAPETP